MGAGARCSGSWPGGRWALAAVATRNAGIPGPSRSIFFPSIANPFEVFNQASLRPGSSSPAPLFSLHLPSFKAATGSLDALENEVKHSHLNDGPAPPEDVKHIVYNEYGPNNDQPPRPRASATQQKQGWPCDV
ncbi:hypothetical protein ABPG75_012539 [Micractinium tetrahymenae]